ncbi:MAG: phosphatase PAP2 family protein [Thermomicrobiales bacterium]|nr:phosphatase PAP2 family protein [Thermomicrobiales bacterium]
MRARFTPLVLGRGIFLPPTTRDWVFLFAVLAVTAFALRVVADLPTAALGVAIGCITYTIDKHLYLPVAIALVSVLAVVLRLDARGDRPGVRAAKEGLLIGAGFLFYEHGRSVFVGDESIAHMNAERVLDFERRLHLMFEPILQRPVLDHETLMRVLNTIYSFAYLPFVLGALFWLYLADDRTFRAMRTSLGISVLFALAAIALFPVAPPRLVASSDLVDTHALLGRAHGFVNPFAAIPSFHVGWTALSGYALFRSVRGPIRWFWGFGPVAVMSATVILTGNHYWVDGVIGTAFALAPMLVLTSDVLPMPRLQPLTARLQQSAHAVRASAWAHWSIAALGILLGYLLGRQVIDPWFTHYWGYMVGQIAVTIVILIVLETHFVAQGGLSWLTYAVVVLATWADTLGTAGHMYDRYAGYDKIIHFGGGVAITAVAADLICAHRRKRGARPRLRQALMMALAISLVLNVGWEVYEYLGDRVFSTGRHAGWLDTTYDLICDTTGAIVALILLNHVERSRFMRATGGVAAGLWPVGTGAWLSHHVRRLAGVVRQRPATGRTGEDGSARHRGVDRFGQLFLGFGLAIPVVFLAFAWLAAIEVPDYDQMSGTISDLADQGQPTSATMRIGVVICGLLYALFTSALVPLLPRLRWPIAASMFATSVMVVLVGIFQDYSTGGPRNLEGFLHNSAGVVMTVGLLISIVLVGYVAYVDRNWRPLFWPSGICFEIVFLNAAFFMWGPAELEGLVQRVEIVAALSWLVALAATALHVAAMAHSTSGAVRTRMSAGVKWHWARAIVDAMHHPTHRRHTGRRT